MLPSETSSETRKSFQPRGAPAALAAVGGSRCGDFFEEAGILSSRLRKKSRRRIAVRHCGWPPLAIVRWRRLPTYRKCPPIQRLLPADRFCRRARNCSYARKIGIPRLAQCPVRAPSGPGWLWPRLVLMTSIITGMDTSSPLDRPPVGARAPALRARVTNHQDLLPGLDGRSATARRFRDLVNAFVADMGGLDRCSEIKLGLIRRLAATTVQAEMLEARMVNGEAIDIAILCTLASTTVRISQRLGLERRARNVTPSLGQYLAARAPATGDSPSMDAEGTE
jgi:hypothetical protein